MARSTAFDIHFTLRRAKSSCFDAMVEPREFKRYFFDIAVPRDIAITESENIKIYAVDDLQEIVNKNLALCEE